MGVAGRVVGVFTTETGQWSAGCQKAKKDLDQVDGSYKSFLKNLKGDFGKGSQLGQTMKLLAGGGAIAGIAMASHELVNFSQKLIDIKNGFNDGSKSSQEMALAIAESIPLLGSFVEFGANIGELITGQKAAEAKLKTELAESLKLQEAQKKSAQEYKDILDEIAAKQRKEHRENQKVGASPLEQKRLDTDQKKEDQDKLRKEDEKKTIDKAKERLTQDYGAMFDDLDKLKIQQEQYKPGNLTDEGDNLRQYKAMQKKIDAQEKLMDERVKKFEAEKKAARKTRADREKEQNNTLDNEYTEAELAEKAEREDKANKAKQEMEDKFSAAGIKATVDRLNAAGEKERAEIEAIEDENATAKKKNILEAQEKIKELGSAATLDVSDEIMKKALNTNKLLDIDASTRIKGVKDATTKALLDSVETPVEAYQKKISEYQKLLSGGIISPETFKKMSDSELKKFKDSFLPKDEETPFKKYAEEVDRYTEALKANAITQEEYKAAVADAQEQLKKEATPEWKQADQQVRRFTFGNLSTPKMDNPLQGMLEVAKDTNKIAQDQRDIMSSVNDKIEKALQPPVVISGASL